jgi:hypothetical protein
MKKNGGRKSRETVSLNALIVVNVNGMSFLIFVHLESLFNIYPSSCSTVLAPLKWCGSLRLRFRNINEQAHRVSASYAKNRYYETELIRYLSEWENSKWKIPQLSNLPPTWQCMPVYRIRTCIRLAPRSGTAFLWKAGSGTVSYQCLVRTHPPHYFVLNVGMKIFLSIKYCKGGYRKWRFNIYNTFWWFYPLKG